MRRVLLSFVLGMVGILAAGCGSKSPTSTSGGGGATTFNYPFIHTFGVFGGGTNGTFSNGPSGIAVGSGAVYVGDSSYAAVDKFDLDGNYLGQVPYGTSDIGGMATDKYGNVYVTNYTNGSVDEYDQNLNFIQSFTGGQFGTVQNFSGPYGVAVDSSRNLYVGDYTNDLVYKVDQTDTILTTSSGTLSMSEIYQVALAPNGSVYVCDYGNGRIVALNSSLVSTGSFDGSNGGTAFIEVCGVAVDSQGNVIASDYSNGNVQKFSSNGVFQEAIGNSSSSVTWSNPYFMAIDPSTNNLYVSDNGNGFVGVFQP